MPHGRVDAKYDQKKKLGELNELAVSIPSAVVLGMRANDL